LEPRREPLERHSRALGAGAAGRQIRLGLARLAVGNPQAGVGAAERLGSRHRQEAAGHQAPQTAAGVLPAAAELPVEPVELPEAAGEPVALVDLTAAAFGHLRAHSRRSVAGWG